jgi:hypothetical protein
MCDCGCDNNHVITEINDDVTEINDDVIYCIKCKGFASLAEFPNEYAQGPCGFCNGLLVIDSLEEIRQGKYEKHRIL